MVKPSKPQPVAALVRGLDILSSFDRPRLELTVSEIARRVGLSQPTTWRLCQTLLDQGYLVRSTSGTALRIGAPALSLGYSAIASLSFVEIALPYMREVTAVALGTTALSRRHGRDMIGVERVDGIFIRPNEAVGWRASLGSVASGIAVLAALSPTALEAAMGALAEPTERWAARRRRIEDARRFYAEQGYVRATYSLHGAYTSLAVPLFEDNSDPADQWALTCGEVADRWGPEGVERAAAALKRARKLLQPALTAAAAAE
jgi:DNA-binding IclR family transcriptional regulator